MVTKLVVDGHVLEVRRETINISTMVPSYEPDPNWAHRDDSGHVHTYGEDGRSTPTLTLHTEPDYWCPDCHDEHSGDSQLCCTECGDEVRPGRRFAPSPTVMAGPSSYLLDGEPISGEDAKAWVATVQLAQMGRVR